MFSYIKNKIAQIAELKEEASNLKAEIEALTVECERVKNKISMEEGTASWSRDLDKRKAEELKQELTHESNLLIKARDALKEEIRPLEQLRNDIVKNIMETYHLTELKPKDIPE